MLRISDLSGGVKPLKKERTDMAKNILILSASLRAGSNSETLANALFPSDYAFRDIYLLASATEDEPDTDERAIHGLEGWIACYEKCRLAGTVFAGGVTEPGAIAGHPALETARAMGAAIA